MLVEELADWALDTYRREAVPEPVLRFATLQRKSVFSALAASTALKLRRRRNAGQSPEACLHDAVENAAALDFDDYICFGHAGLSSVLTSAVTASGYPVRHDQVAIAQVVANELHARVAGACLLGPHGPTQWAYAHALSAAAAAGLVMGLDTRELRNAFAIALAQPPVPALAAFFGPDTRSLAVANASALGMHAARMAADGRTGPLHILDDRRGGVFPVVVRRALPEMFSALGQGWALRTLSVKTAPACSYVDPVLNAVQKLMPIAAENVDHIDIAASLPTCQMTALAHRYLRHSGLTPSIAAFSARLSAALLLHNGTLTPYQLAPGELRHSEDAVIRLAGRIRIRHSPWLTQKLLASLAGAFPLHRIAGRRIFGGFSGAAPARPWSPEALAAFRMTFPVRLTVSLRGGRKLREAADVPPGAAGSHTVSPAAAAEAKFATWPGNAWGAPLADKLRHAADDEADTAWSVLAAGAMEYPESTDRREEIQSHGR